MGNFAAFKSVAGLEDVIKEFFEPINSMVSGDLTKEQWIKDVKEATDLMRENLIK